MIRKHSIVLVLLLILVVPTTWSQGRAIRPANQQLSDDVRQALVIGNSAYASAGVLRNPVNDAKAISNTLEQLGFKVTTVTDADQREMEQSIRNFGKQLRDYNGVGLFYYAGHGMQFDGENYLLPVDINPSTETDVRYDAVPLGKMLGQMQNAGNRMNLVILDACRNNPFARSFRTFNPGLAQVIAPEGTFISFATAPGKVAADGDGRNGLFTSKLLRHLKTPGLKLEEVFKRTAADVYRESNKKQVPWVQYAVIGDFYFVGGDTSTVEEVSKRTAAEVYIASLPINKAKQKKTPYISEDPFAKDSWKKTLYISMDNLDKADDFKVWKTNKVSNRDAVYIGEVRDGIPNGSGSITFAHGYKYIGGFQEGLPHTTRASGWGTATSPSGKIYNGEFERGNYHGRGVLTYPDGTTADGTWNDGKFKYRWIYGEDDERYKRNVRDGK